MEHIDTLKHKDKDPTLTARVPSDQSIKRSDIVVPDIQYDSRSKLFCLGPSSTPEDFLLAVASTELTGVDSSSSQSLIPFDCFLCLLSFHVTLL